jgi:hypothetical protein
MRNDLSDVTVVLDRSGSMASCRDDAEGGLNTFVEEQKKHTGETLFTLVQFDTDYEFVHKGKPVREVGPCELVPRGATALLDAVGRAIVETGERLAAMPEPERPGLVVFVILTDGQENSSKEYTKSKIKEMIERQQNVYSWQFTFLGANQDAFSEAQSLGIYAAAAANFIPKRSKEAFLAASANVHRMRAAVGAGKQAYCAYSDDEVRFMQADEDENNVADSAPPS